MTQQIAPRTQLEKVVDSDRKRILNVLAQRRYRQRKKQRIATLEEAVRKSAAERHTTVGSQASLENAPNPHMFDFSPQLTVAPTLLDSVSVAERPEEAAPATQEDVFQSFTNFDMYSGDLANLEISQFSFSDDHVLEVPELECMKTAFAFAKLLRCENNFWDLKAVSIFDLPEEEISVLPEILRPTLAQKQIPHHPMLDLIPWPSVRSKLILVLSQPPEVRPPNIRDDMALVNLMYDIDDPAEGMKVSGADRLNLENWEIGQQVFQNWWWAFDRDVILTSNSRRVSRGAPRLALK